MRSADWLCSHRFRLAAVAAGMLISATGGAVVAGPRPDASPARAAAPLLAQAAAPSPGPAGAPPQGPHPFTVRDMVRMERLTEPQPSPDGRQVVFSRRTYDWDSNKTTINLWIVGIDGRGLRPLTSAAARDGGAQWSPDGRTIAFVSNRGGSSQIWTIDPTGGEAIQLTRFPLDVENVRWSPDGTRLAFSAEVYPDCADFACTADRDKALADDPATGRIYERLPIRHWDEWEDGKRRHLFVWPVAGGTPVDIMKGADADSPTKPFGGIEDFSWSPDGRSIAFAAKMRPDAAWSTDIDIYLASTDGKGYRAVSEDNEAEDSQPVFSPDGRSLAWLAMERPGYEADRRRVVLQDVASGRRRVLTAAWDRSPGSIAWLPDGRGLIVTAEDLGRDRMFRVEAIEGPGRVVPLPSEGSCSAVSVAKGDRLVFLRQSMTAPAEVYAARLDGKDARALTSVNASRLANIRFSAPEEFWFQGARGDKVHGWLLRPVGFEAGRRYPIAFMIHGGPQGAWTDQFHYRWNHEIYAAAGYVTVAINFHGSTGYGQAFTDAIRMDWGGAPYEDLMKGLDYVIERYQFADGDRACALGASYGGWMVNWIAGHTDRFKCLVSHDGELDITSSYYSTEELWFPEWEMGGSPWERRDLYARFSPEKSVDKWKTPMLVIHGGKDYRLVDTEGMSVFTALQRRGVPSKFLYFPDENHWVLKPRNSVLWHDTVLAWLERFTK
jgi:dipeptidyl aminopeptidase/acylaminoacyl peptidase